MHAATSVMLAQRAHRKRRPCTARRSWPPCARACAPAGGQQGKRQECQRVSTKTPRPVRTCEDRARRSIIPLNHHWQVGYWPRSDIDGSKKDALVYAECDIRWRHHAVVRTWQMIIAFIMNKPRAAVARRLRSNRACGGCRIPVRAGRPRHRDRHRSIPGRRK